MLRHVAIASLFLVAACACGGKPSTPTTPEPGPSEPGPTEPTVDLATLGTPCGEGDACPTGLTCAKYYGIAGPSGPEFKSCEISCADKAEACPSGSSCATIADGPGAVCRAAEPTPDTAD